MHGGLHSLVEKVPKYEYLIVGIELHQIDGHDLGDRHVVLFAERAIAPGEDPHHPVAVEDREPRDALRAHGNGSGHH